MQPHLVGRMHRTCGCSSAGRARPCHGRGQGFELPHPLQGTDPAGTCCRVAARGRVASRGTASTAPTRVCPCTSFRWLRPSGCMCAEPHDPRAATPGRCTGPSRMDTAVWKRDRRRTTGWRHRAPAARPGGETGRRTGSRVQRPRSCRFDSGSGHQNSCIDECTARALVDANPGRLRSARKAVATLSEGESPTSLPAWRASVGSFRQAHRGATSAGSSSQGAVLIGTRVQGKESWPARRRPQGRRERRSRNRKRVVASGLAVPTRHRVIGKGSVISPSFAGKGSAQNERDVGFARGTRIAKVGQVTREVNGRRCVVFRGPKDHGATGDAHRRRLQVAQLVEHRPVKATVAGSIPVCQTQRHLRCLSKVA